MGKLQQFSIQLEQPNVALYAGQRLLGCVSLTLNEPMKCRNVRLTLTGKAKTKWDEGSGDNNRTYRGSESYMDKGILLFGCPDGKYTTKIPEGSHQYPFEFVIPPNCPTYFEGKYGWIRYCLTAVIDRPWKFDNKIELFLKVQGRHDLNKNPMAMQPIEEFIKKSLGVKKKSGELTCFATMPCCGLVPGQQLNLSVRIETTSMSGMKAVKVYLEQCEEFIANNGHAKIKRYGECLASNEDFILGNTPTTLDFTNVLIPPGDPTIINCSIINIMHYIHVAVIPGGMDKKLDVLKFPIIIGSTPLRSAVEHGMTLEPCQVQHVFSAQPSDESYVIGQLNVEKGDGEEGYAGKRNQTDNDHYDGKKKGGISDPSFVPKHPACSFQN